MILNKLLEWIKNLFNNPPATGSIPSPTDERDYKLSGTDIEKIDYKTIPSYSEWSIIPPNQLRTQACVGFSIARIMQILANRAANKKGYKDTTRNYSALYNWYWARKKRGMPDKNVGVFVRDALKELFDKGFVPENSMPFKSPWLREPSNFSQSIGTSLASNILLNNNYKYYQVTRTQMRKLVNKGVPVLVGCYTSPSMSRRTYSKVEPNNGYGHAMVIEGFKERNDTEYIKCMNWWGRGYLYVPTEYMNKNAYEYWVIEAI